MTHEPQNGMHRVGNPVRYFMFQFEQENIKKFIQIAQHINA
jgi:hypothetical protein